MGNKKKRKKGQLKKHSRMRKRGRLGRCSHIDRLTGIRCGNRVGTVKSDMRTFCKTHKGRHDSRNKTRAIIRNDNRRKEEESH